MQNQMRSQRSARSSQQRAAAHKMRDRLSAQVETVLARAASLAEKDRGMRAALGLDPNCEESVVDSWRCTHAGAQGR